MAGRAAGDNGRDIGRLEHKLLVFIRNIALVGRQEHGAALHAFRAQHEGRRHTAAVCNAARCDDRDIHRVNHLRHERHGGQLADVAAAFHTFRDDRVRACALHAFGQRDRRDNRHDLDAGFLPGSHILARIARARGQHLDLLVDGELGEVVRVRGEQHDVHTKRLVRDRTRLADLVADIIDRRCAARDDAEAACLGNRRREVVLRDPRHGALHDRVFNTEQFCNLGFHLLSLPLYSLSTNAP